MGRQYRITKFSVLVLASALGAACGPTTGGRTGAAAPTTAPTAPRPMGKLLFQPYAYYEFKEPLASPGTGFFLRTADGRVAAVTAANVFRFDGPRLTGVHGLSIGDWTPIVTLQQSWGEPGSPSIEAPTWDMRNDYLIMPVDAVLPPDSILELDERTAPKDGEPIWFPYKMASEPRGYELRDGYVEETLPGHIRVKMNRPMTLESHNGSPIISATTGKVIGLIARSGKVRQESVFWLCRASSLRNAIETAEKFPRLQDVVGQRGGH